MSAHVVVAGASGLIGKQLVRSLEERGDRVTTLVRSPAHASGEVRWDPTNASLDPSQLAGADAVVVLNGASVGRVPWTKSYRELLFSSRIDSTNTVVAALNELGTSAPALISASAVGYYGSVPGKVLTESDGPGATFLARLCVEWEAAARKADSVTRVALLRTAPVLHRQGMLRPMIGITSVGLAGPLGGGSQVWPWISLDDEVRAILHTIDKQLSGPVNLCSPNSATADDIGRSLARELHRPYWLPAPAWGLRLALGRSAADSLLTADADVRPEVLLDSGFTFTHNTVEAAVSAAAQGA